jgi:hypothetical protein
MRNLNRVFKIGRQSIRRGYSKLEIHGGRNGHEEGIPENKIYAHQILSEPSSIVARYIRCDPLETAHVANGRIGVTRYGMIDAQIFKSIYERAGFNWGIFEWNIWSNTLNTYENYLTMLRAMYQYGLRVVCPYAWLSGHPYEQLQIANNTNFKRAIHDFAQMVGDKPRGTHPQGFMTFADILESQYTGVKGYFDKNWYFLFVPLGGFLATLIPLQVIKCKSKPRPSSL